MKNGKINLTFLNQVARRIGIILKNSKNKPIIAIKSTVTPGTNEKIKQILENYSNKKTGKDFSLISNPEFLREGKALEDTLKPHIIVMGGNKKKSLDKIKKFYQKIYGTKIPYVITNTQTAEMIKYANNSFLATKISFINQIANICNSIPGTNVDDVANAIGLDPRIGNLFLKAGPGYGGSCLPKDLQAIISYSKTKHENVNLLRAVQKTNSNQLLQISKTIKEKLGKMKNEKITVLGLSFKEDTDDIRESVSIKLIKLLLKNKMNVTVHDPMAIENTKHLFGKKIKYASSINEALKDSQCAIIMTPWKQYSKISNKNLKQMKKKRIIDTRRILKKKEGIEYYAIGIGN